MKNEVEEVAELLHDNIEKVIERGDKLENTLERTDDLIADAQQFKKTSKKVKKKYCFKNMKMTCVLIIVGIVVVLLLILVIVLVTKPWQSSDGGGGHMTTRPPCCTGYLQS